MNLENIEKTINDIELSNMTIEQVMGEVVSLWVKNKCEDRLRIDFYDPYKNSIVIDIGSYDGVWIKKFVDMHDNCKAICFEPSSKFYNKSLQNLSGYIDKNKIIVNKYGLGEKDNIAFINDDLGLATKIQATGSEKIIIKDIGEILSAYDEIYLLKMNIEGSEYKCIPRLIETGLIKRIKNLQIQFHPIGTKKETIDSYRKIFKMLSQTHKIDYFFPFIWENWSLNVI